ncbi:hypothetical protein [Thalassotalea profundi]|nr:hypothetical protein [Thalassotalea profundi]
MVIVTCSTIEQGTGDLSQKNSVDKATLVDFDLSARKNVPEDSEPSDYIIAAHSLTTNISALIEYVVFNPSFALITRHTINTRAPPHSTSV